MRFKILPYLFALLFVGCTDDYSIDSLFQDSENDIHVGAVTDIVSIRVDNSMTRADGDGDNGNTDEEIRQDAENVSWLLSPLFHGLQIRYGYNSTEKVAMLKLLKKDDATGETHDDIKYSDEYIEDGVSKQLAEYSFRYYDQNAEGANAQWMGNGDHYFHGVYVPEVLKYQSSDNITTVNDPTSGKAPSLITDQSQAGVINSKVGNYTLLERYLAMPANQTIKATVSRIKLPFSHRLARVLVFVLIDPTLVGAKLKGYDYKKNSDGTVTPDDPSTTELYFGNVKVLAGVKELTDANGIQRLHPQWKESRLVTPHFIGEVGCVDQQLHPLTGFDQEHFIPYYKIEDKEYIYPTSSKWPDAKAAWDNKYNAYLTQHPDKESEAIEYADANSGYRRTVYGTVPVYDIIIQPTYTNEKMVVYDEELTDEHDAAWFAGQKNKIDFELTLSNDLNYSRSVDIDLDANYQTAIFLRVNAESVDYSKSGSEKWIEESNPDDYYGVNNQNGNTLSYAGSSWQRAYRIGDKSKNWNVTDGHWYDKDDDSDDSDNAMPWYPQYVTQAKWLEMFAEAYEGGKHHGDYFILDQNIEIDATKLPDNFVFTGHLDGQMHTIKLVNGGKDWNEYVETTDYTISPLYSNKNGTIYNLPQLYTYHTANYANDSELFQIGEKWYLKSSLKHVTVQEVSHEATEQDVTDGKAEHVGDKVVDVSAVDTYEIDETKTPVEKLDAGYDEAHPSMQEVMNAPEGTYYVKVGNNYEDFYSKKPSILYKAIPHTSGTTLFAGLNGAYSAEAGVANVHKENNGILVPYVDDATHTGWRAEVTNTKITDADMFPASAYDAAGNYNVSVVSGYVYNCWKDDTKIKGHTPALPKY